MGFRHDEVRNLFGEFFKRAGYVSVTTEPHLIRLTEEQKQKTIIDPITSNMTQKGYFEHNSAITSDDARADISCINFLTSHMRSFFDVRVTNPNRKGYGDKELSQIYHEHEQEKRNNYEERIIEVEHGSFFPLVFSIFGGAAPEANFVLKALAKRIAERENDHVSCVMGYLRTRLCFPLLRSALVCLRDCRKRTGKDAEFAEFQLDSVDAQLSCAI